MRRLDRESIGDLAGSAKNDGTDPPLNRLERCTVITIAERRTCTTAFFLHKQIFFADLLRRDLNGDRWGSSSARRHVLRA